MNAILIGGALLVLSTIVSFFVGAKYAAETLADRKNRIVSSARASVDAMRDGSMSVLVMMEAQRKAAGEEGPFPDIEEARRLLTEIGDVS